MKAEELMRYDWVCLEDDNTPRQVDWIRSGEVGLFWNQIVTPPYLKPILLTKEILEKNGFKYDELPKFAVNEITEKTKMTFSYHSGSRTVFVGVSEPNFNLTSACVLYVHKLQHALRLCGIEKEIEL